MNSISAGEAVGSVPFVAGGRVRVGFPGAPGWTTTGGPASVCCVPRVEEKALARVLADTSAPEHAAMLNTTRIPQVNLEVNLIWIGLTCRKYLTIVGLTISYPAGTSHSADAWGSRFLVLMRDPDAEPLIEPQRRRSLRSSVLTHPHTDQNGVGSAEQV
jgi:hypothetical protein